MAETRAALGRQVAGRLVHEGEYGDARQALGGLWQGSRDCPASGADRTLLSRSVSTPLWGGTSTTTEADSPSTRAVVRINSSPSQGGGR